VIILVKNHPSYDSCDVNEKFSWKTPWRKLWRVRVWIHRALVAVLPFKPAKPTTTAAIAMHVSEDDAWSAAAVMPVIAHALLSKLIDVRQKHASHSYFIVEPEYGPDHLVNDDYERWVWALNEIKWALAHIIDDGWEDQFMTGEIDFQFKKLPNGMSEMVEGPNHTFEVDHGGLDRYNARIQHGLFLFGVYFRYLWI
jgi:hypothetical protein